MSTYLITKSGFGIEVEISESELVKLKGLLNKGDVINSVEE
jgi:hypothetical protein